MFASVLARHASPTLAGLKTGALFSFAFSGQQEMLTTLLHWNQRLSGKGLRLLPLRQSRDRTLLYLYRPSALALDLRRPQVIALLQPRGYPCAKPDRCVVHLQRQLQDSSQFPHEIGLFLGYPAEDVRGFMLHSTPCKLSGCWKVYSDVDVARVQFARFRACTRLYCRSLALGIPLEHLAVSG